MEGKGQTGWLDRLVIRSLLSGLLPGLSRSTIVVRAYPVAPASSCMHVQLRPLPCRLQC
jgi:hypothetical protein